MGLMLFINPMLPFSSEGQTLAVTFHTIRDRRIVALLLKSYYAAELYHRRCLTICSGDFS